MKNETKSIQSTAIANKKKMDDFDVLLINIHSINQLKIDNIIIE